MIPYMTIFVCAPKAKRVWNTRSAAAAAVGEIDCSDFFSREREREREKQGEPLVVNFLVFLFGDGLSNWMLRAGRCRETNCRHGPIERERENSVCPSFPVWVSEWKPKTRMSRGKVNRECRPSAHPLLSVGSPRHVRYLFLWVGETDSSWNRKP